MRIVDYGVPGPHNYTIDPAKVEVSNIGNRMKEGCPYVEKDAERRNEELLAYGDTFQY